MSAPAAKQEKAKIPYEINGKAGKLEVFTSKGMHPVAKNTGKCDGTADCPRRGKHKTGCLKSEGVEAPVAEAQDEPERPLSEFVSDWVSKCCKVRVLQRGGQDSRQWYECTKCGSSCEPVMPKVETIKGFSCEKCGANFTADVSGDIKCTECGSGEYWPTS